MLVSLLVPFCARARTASQSNRNEILVVIEGSMAGGRNVGRMIKTTN